MDHATIIVDEEEARPHPSHVKVRFENADLGHEVMTFDVSPGEKCSSLKARVATTCDLSASKIRLWFNGNVQEGYSHMESFGFKVQSKGNESFFVTQIMSYLILFFSHAYFLTCEHPRKSDKATLRDWGVRSGDTLTIQVPSPYPPHVTVTLGTST